ncbi:hypothetical protein ACMHYQ_07335 [Ectopseudomonas guguanensis]|jgi:hypothetical protein|uniref:hypothetical protein n=1 Tax=Ectopseudomonas TaxID=3236654 RepID=UPI000423ADEC|nr:MULTISPECIES: hypothetical protein [Pseudomonas]ATH79915.1 hypothetical protein CO724_01610 [Pseudomonas mendocina]AQZ35802.1 hypothetical protein BHQ29_22620 [Pseudomonas sp. LPH1]MPT18623.1 hypothetical protein [Pseudomonas sp.]UTH36514.1 hypothetical protein NLY39_23155 [Pseudomonas sp. KHPS1]WJH59472.1 hypothetical protein FE254_26340 [Pseudomonas guguanensis]
MKRADVKRRTAEGVLFDTQIMANPANTAEWIVFFKKEAGRSFFLVDETEQVETFASLDEVIPELRLLGIKRVEVQL